MSGQAPPAVSQNVRRSRIVMMRDSEYFLSLAIRRLQDLADSAAYGNWDQAVGLCQQARSIAREQRKQTMRSIP